MKKEGTLFTIIFQMNREKQLKISEHDLCHSAEICLHKQSRILFLFRIALDIEDPKEIEMSEIQKILFLKRIVVSVMRMLTIYLLRNLSIAKCWVNIFRFLFLRSRFFQIRIICLLWQIILSSGIFHF